MSDPNAMIKSLQQIGNQMTNSEFQELLAKNILNRYTPIAFMCACKGADWDCQETLNDPYTNGVMDTVRRIAEYIKDFDPTL